MWVKTCQTNNHVEQTWTNSAFKCWNVCQLIHLLCKRTRVMPFPIPFNRPSQSIQRHIVNDPLQIGWQNTWTPWVKLRSGMAVGYTNITGPSAKPQGIWIMSSKSWKSTPLTVAFKGFIWVHVWSTTQETSQGKLKKWKMCAASVFS